MAEQTKAQGRSSFASRFGFIMVAAGAAIGLGNVWRFPYQAYENGGAAFILVYIIIVAIIGKAGIEMEAAIGRNGKCNAIRAYGKINKNSRFIGGIGILFTFMLDMYYVVVGGSVLWYAVNYLISGDFGTDTAVYYDQFISNPIIPLICTAVLMAIIGVILSAGITKWV